MINYCKCTEVDETYISYSKDICCSSCFRVVREEAPKLIKNSVSVTKDEQNYYIKHNGVTVKHFNMLAEDYAFTLAYRYANLYIKELKSNDQLTLNKEEIE